jgi:hypothetical protein
LKRSELRTYFGIKTSKIEVLPDAEMREDDGLTTFEPRHVTIQIKESVYANAIWRRQIADGPGPRARSGGDA